MMPSDIDVHFGYNIPPRYTNRSRMIDRVSRDCVVDFGLFLRFHDAQADINYNEVNPFLCAPLTTRSDHANIFSSNTSSLSHYTFRR